MLLSQLGRQKNEALTVLWSSQPILSRHQRHKHLILYLPGLLPGFYQKTLEHAVAGCRSEAGILTVQNRSRGASQPEEIVAKNLSTVLILCQGSWKPRRSLTSLLRNGSLPSLSTCTASPTPTLFFPLDEISAPSSSV